MIPFLIIMLAGVGFIISFYVNYNKTRNKKMVCVIGKDCNEVIFSRYGKTFDIANAFFGMLYYLVLIVYFGIFLFFTHSFYFLLPLLIILAGITVLFSIYLIYIQAFILKKWCAWCVATAIINVFIFIPLLLL